METTVTIFGHLQKGIREKRREKKGREHEREPGEEEREIRETKPD
jgi:hypothetical protein